MSSLFSDYLEALGVRHTEEYSDSRFATMQFKSMFGLANLLKEYGVATVGVKLPEQSRAEAMAKLPVPFLADTPDGFAIVTAVDGGVVSYRSQHKMFTAPVDEVAGGWNGIALLASTGSLSVEPDYLLHHVGELARNVKKWILVVLVVVLPVFALWSSGLYKTWSAWVLLLFDCAGLYQSWMLVQKSLGIHNVTADMVCSVIEDGGCDEIARSEASSFMGIFKWSEVGLAYFSVSMAIMLIYPRALPVLAAINILCLPYTVWSIWYQRFRAKTWCTLCVCVQCTLWLLFFTYLAGGWTGRIFPLSISSLIGFIVAGCVYVAVLLGINRLDSAMLKYIKNGQSPNS